LIVETGDAREVHHYCLLIGYGASAINPYLAFETLDDMIRQNLLTGIDHRKAVNHYTKAVKKGVVKVMSKMGISTLQSYRGAQISRQSVSMRSSSMRISRTRRHASVESGSTRLPRKPSRVIGTRFPSVRYARRFGLGRTVPVRQGWRVPHVQPGNDPQAPVLDAYE